MAVQTIVGMVIETEAEEEEVVSVAIETDTEAYLVAPEEMAEELLDLMGHRVEVTGTVIEEEDRPPIIEVDSYTEVYDETEEEEEEEEEEGEGVSAEADLED